MKPIANLLCLLGILSTVCVVAKSQSIEFPEPVRETIEWCRVWLPQANQDELPRVLLIGDSIAVGYHSAVEERLKDNAYVGYLATSRSVCDPIFFDELKLVLKQYEYKVIHFNSGLHGWGYTEEQYKKGLHHLVEVIQSHAPKSHLIWAHSTPHNLGDQKDQLNDLNQRISERNRIADSLMEQYGIPVNDLFELCYGMSEWYSSDKVHFQTQGKTHQAEQVASMIRQQMP